MKCQCGYEYVSDWSLEDILEDNPSFVNGKNEFIPSKNEIQFMFHDGDCYSDGYMNKTIYACPECGTLKIEV